MTDDRKPRKFEIFYSGLAGTFSVRNNFDAHIMSEREDLSDEYIRLIEIEPTLQLMKELGEALDEVHPDDFVYDEGDQNIKIANQVVSVLKKYRKFLEALK